MSKNLFPALQNLKASVEMKDWQFSFLNGKGVERIREGTSFPIVFKRTHFIYCQDKITCFGNQKFNASLMSFLKIFLWYGGTTCNIFEEKNSC